MVPLPVIFCLFFLFGLLHHLYQAPFIFYSVPLFFSPTSLSLSQQPTFLPFLLFLYLFPTNSFSSHFPIPSTFSLLALPSSSFPYFLVVITFPCCFSSSLLPHLPSLPSTYTLAFFFTTFLTSLYPRHSLFPTNFPYSPFF